ncbi:MAG: hypothetical protein IJK07_01425 [Bacteroidales bacterium]|nr:hypothetical protein [Bacteroidales bacterium]
MKRIVIIFMFAALCASAQTPSDSASFSKHFLEARMQLGPGDHVTGEVQFNITAAFGLQYAYVPERWGWYSSLSYANFQKSDFIGATGGAVYRLCGKDSKIDFQFYYGLALAVPLHSGFNTKLGLDAGIRIANGAKADRSKFSWMSATLGLTNFWDKPFVTMGLSIDVAAVVAGLTMLRIYL